MTYIRQVKSSVGIEDNWEDGEGDLQDSKLEGAELEQEERAPGVRTEEINSTVAVTREKTVLVSTCQLKTIQSRVWNSHMPRSEPGTIFARCFGQLKEALGILAYWLQVHICNNAFNSPSAVHYNFLIKTSICFHLQATVVLNRKSRGNWEMMGCWLCFFHFRRVWCRDSLLYHHPPDWKCWPSPVFHFSDLFL